MAPAIQEAISLLAKMLPVTNKSVEILTRLFAESHVILSVQTGFDVISVHEGTHFQ
jgi:hypothetical protein